MIKKPRPEPGRKPKLKRKKSKRKKLNLKEYNIDALESNIRQTTSRYGCCFCRGGLVNPGRGFKKRIFRKESCYISR